MLNQDKAIGNYLTGSQKLGITGLEREYMISTLKFLHANKHGYKHETFHLACNIADRYLKHLKIIGKKAPNLTMLAATALLMAAKME